jgi:glycosyltransferase involved in cell wall biosynthesis
VVGESPEAVACNVIAIPPMIHLFINALSASAGGGLTYVRNCLPLLALREEVRTTLLVGDVLGSEIAESANITVLSASQDSSSGGRFLFEQRRLPDLIRQSGANVLLSTGNFAVFRSPVPQILLSRNALYLSSDFLRDVRERGDHRLWMDTKIKGALARWSIQAADCTVAPSNTFAEDLSRWTGMPVHCIHHGFDSESFFRDSTPLPPAVQANLDAARGAFRILFVSHYNYYRNFETLIRAIAIAKQKLHPQQLRLFLTCKLASTENPGTYNAESAAQLVRQLNLAQEIVELGSVPYSSLHHLYRSCHAYATPAYAETFAHPLVEAMASGLPVIASDLPVHREICGDATKYFPRFSPENLAECIVELFEAENLRKEMSESGLRRSRDFRWATHVDAMLALAGGLVRSAS